MVANNQTDDSETPLQLAITSAWNAAKQEIFIIAMTAGAVAICTAAIVLQMVAIGSHMPTGNPFIANGCALLAALNTRTGLEAYLSLSSRMSKLPALNL